MEYSEFVEDYNRLRTKALELLDVIQVPMDAIVPPQQVCGSYIRAVEHDRLSRYLETACRTVYGELVEKLFGRMAPQGPVLDLYLEMSARKSEGADDISFRHGLLALMQSDDAMVFRPSPDRQQDMINELEQIILQDKSIREGYASYRDRFDLYRLVTCYEARLCLGLLALSEGASLSQARRRANRVSLSLCDAMIELNGLQVSPPSSTLVH